ncbi:MAG: ferrous iron transport protein A [Methanimicrococcus sp.]|nr:ferrous iron transport protein A [Methanimicrococcus sp.]
MTKTLNEVKPGRTCKVVNIGGTNILKNRLLCMGVTPGTIIEVVKAAPLGDPLELKIRRYNLALRKSEASDIFIEDVSESEGASES